jgi:uncharacterized membrane-anchored protein YhcB (DUF1043 family)
MVSFAIAAPLIAVLSLIAGVVGSFVGVRFTANAANETAKESKHLVEETRDILGGMRTSVAVHEVRIGHLEKQVDRLHAT